MNVALLNDSFPPLLDGVANTVVNYGNILTSHGNGAVVVTPQHPDADDGKFGYPVIRYPGLDVRDKIGYIAGYPFSPNVIEALKQHKVTLLHSHCPMASTILARSIKDRISAPLIFTYHTKFDIDIANAIRGKLLQEGAVKALVDNITGCDEVWVVSRGAGENLKSLGYQGDYIVMENGVDMARGRLPEDVCRSATKGFDLPDKLPLFLFVGRLMWYKGIKIIIDALAALRSQNVDFRMVFVGSGQDREEIAAYVRQLKLDNKIFFTGPVYDRTALCSWYCRADLFLFPSSFDTNGLVVREAAACGLPSVLIGGSCAAEGVTNRRNGYLIEENPASLAVLLTQISPDKSLMRACGERASKELYISWEESVSRAEERYRIVEDNFLCGRYNKRPRPTDEFFKLQGDLMEMLTEVRRARERLEETIERYL